MADTTIFEVPQMDVDLKTYVKLRCKAALNDTAIFKFYVYSESSPVDLTNYKVEMIARLPKSGNVYSEADNIVINGNELTVTCDSVLTSEIGEVIITLRIVDITTYKQKSNYIIVLKVMSTIDADEEIQTSATLSALESLDYAINRYFELKVDLTDKISAGTTLLNNLISNIATGTTLNANLTIQNNQATTNITNLTTQNNNAINNINTLTSQNNQAVVNNNNLINGNNQAVINYTNLTNANNTASGLDGDLNNDIIVGSKLLSDLNTANSVVNNKIDNHINDNVRHINTGEREKWNMSITQLNDLMNMFDLLMVGSPLTTETGDTFVTEAGDSLVI
jgi:hypothetical protein